MLAFALFFSTQTYANDVELSELNSAYTYYATSGNATVPPEAVENNANSASTPSSGTGGLGDLASNLLEPIAIVAALLTSASIIIGFTCLFASFVRYMQHRKNPLAHPIGTVVWLLIIGLVLFCLPLVYKLTESGIPIHLP